MSGPPELRRTDKLMPEAQARALLEGAYCGRLATVGPEGYPYCVPLLHVVLDDEIWMHNARVRGHLRNNVEHEARACFEVDEAGEVFPYGRFECDTSMGYRSVIIFGRVRLVEAQADKMRFFDALMAKYTRAKDGTRRWPRPAGFYPRLNEITVYALSIERLTGKESPLFSASEQWPSVDRTRSPGAAPPIR